MFFECLNNVFVNKIWIRRLAWFGCRTHTAEVKGSNPFGSILHGNHDFILIKLW